MFVAARPLCAAGRDRLNFKMAGEHYELVKRSMADQNRDIGAIETAEVISVCGARKRNPVVKRM